MVVGALNGGLDLLEVVGLVKHLISLWVEVANLADVLLALTVCHSTIRLAHLGVILHNLDSLQIRLELEEIAHDTS